ncbi:MAG: hypothetical protein JJLCMIEE_00098 [Acidimicrobiales bacterium]|nr:hypothetical protein [Acidimicrobiales bacterium]
MSDSRLSDQDSEEHPVDPDEGSSFDVVEEPLTVEEASEAPEELLDGEYVDLPRETSAARRLFTVAITIVVLAALIVGALGFWVLRQIDPPGQEGAAIDELEIPDGSTTNSIAAILEEEGVIANSTVFRYYAQWKNSGDWQAGTYVDFHENMAMGEVIEILEAGPIPPGFSAVTVPEGLRVVDAVKELDEALAGVTEESLMQMLLLGPLQSSYFPQHVASWEGLFFPDTYEFADDAAAAEVLQTMATHMEDVLDELGYQDAEEITGRSAYELIIIASMIEREAKVDTDRAKISRVIHNRLNAGWALGIDATVLYGLDRTSGELTQSDLDTDTPYNTRMHTGLPPTPISLPGRASLEAALHPADGNWMYYVLADEEGNHFFTDSEAEFEEQKQKSQEEGLL